VKPEVKGEAIPTALEIWRRALALFEETKVFAGQSNLKSRDISKLKKRQRLFKDLGIKLNTLDQEKPREKFPQPGWRKAESGKPAPDFASGLLD
jgi:hypothetical protein